jgi:hypothetical protein
MESGKARRLWSAVREQLASADILLSIGAMINPIETRGEQLW